MNSNDNRIYIMRHGNSLANQAGIVVSDPINGLEEYGLSELGIKQVLAAVSGNKALDARTHIYTSDFARARQTADLVSRALGTGPVVATASLRERYFGEYELGPDSIYEQVWQRDYEDPDQIAFGVESANRVARRATELIESLNQKHQKSCILLVAHGDILQILLTTFCGKDASQHRTIPHMDTAEIRQLV